MKKEWFLTELIYRIYDQRCPDVHQFDKQMRLVQATSPREAYQHVLVMASQELDKRNNTGDKDMRWEFAGIGALQRIDQPDTGVDHMELHYVMDTVGAAEEHMHSLRTLHDSLQMRIALTA